LQRAETAAKAQKTAAIAAILLVTVAMPL